MKKFLLLALNLALLAAPAYSQAHLTLASNQAAGTTAAVQWNGSGAFVTVGGTFGGASVDIEFSPNNSDFYDLTGLAALTAATQGSYQMPYGWYRVVVAGGSSPLIDVYFSLYKGPALTPVTTVNGSTTWSSGALAAVTGAGGVLTWQNPAGAAILVTDLILEVTTAATGAATVNAGYAATVVTADNLIDGKDVNAATGFFSNLSDAGTNGRPAQRIPAAEYITATETTGDVTGLVGVYHIGYHVIQ